MLKINFYVCVSNFNSITLKCIKSIVNQTNYHKIIIHIIENNIHSSVNKIMIKRLSQNNNIVFNFLMEKKIGIPYARNKCLEIIRNSKSDFSCFVDDDCELPKYWLKNMLRCFDKTNSEIITGPQISKSNNIYEKVLERKSKHLSKTNWAATNNVFMQSNVVNKNNIKFDKDLKNLGGSDQVFFSKLSRKGYNITWNEYSPVYENRNEKNSNFIWFIRRNIRYGSSSKILYSKIYGPLKANILVFFKFGFEFLKSLMNLEVSLTECE